MTVKVKFSVFRTICGFNFIPWERVIFFYMGSFLRKERMTQKKNDKFITDLPVSFYPMIFSLRLAFWRQHLCPFHFHLFCFEANINIQFPHPFMDTFCSIIRVFHYFCLSLFAGWPTSVLSFPCLFLGGIYF